MPQYMTPLSEADKAAADEAIRTLERVFPHCHGRFAAVIHEVTGSNHGDGQETQVRNLSYVQLAILLLEEIGKPTPITVLLERIRERRNDPTITRGSVETSLLRHLNMKGENTDVVKPCPGTYALRQHVNT
jgi:hypothetical protein